MSRGTARSSAYDVLVLGGSGVDTIVYIPELPRPYAAGFLFGRLSGEPFEPCALYGAVAGAHACTVPATGGDALTRTALLAEVTALTGAGLRA